MWTPIKITDRETNRSININIFERELYAEGDLSFDDLYEICKDEEPLPEKGFLKSRVSKRQYKPEVEKWAK